jgi:hypothetical protein
LYTALGNILSFQYIFPLLIIRNFLFYFMLSKTNKYYPMKIPFDRVTLKAVSFQPLSLESIILSTMFIFHSYLFACVYMKDVMKLRSKMMNVI